MKGVLIGLVARICAVAALLAALASTTGCWSRHELNELAIVVGMGIDEADQGYKVSIQLVNPSQVSTRNGTSSGLQSVVTFSELGRTVPEAVRKMTVKSSKRLMFSHLRIVVFGERLARAGLSKPLDYLSRETEMRNDFFLVVARDATPEEILSTYSAMDPIPANNMFTKLFNSDTLWAATGKITLDRLLMDLASPGKDPVLTVVRISGDKATGHSRRLNQTIEPAAVLVYDGMAAFRSDRMVGWLSPDGTKALNYLQDSIKQTLGAQRCDGDTGYLSLAVTESATKIRIGRNGDRPVIYVHVRVEANLSDVECSADLADPAVTDRILKEGRLQLVRLLQDGIEEAQKMGADIFGFGREVHRQQPALWRKIPDWDELFRSMDVKIDAQLHIRKLGGIHLTIENNVRK
ncbi:Ger(x)C family spore germination protein [Cohnella sp. GCM10020058]|uniref:Ger(x)C family spore germination protein n=1 Tax=Cohnella sp. GCM10020058 TaxID=3317330 RepID=UPI0036433C23